MTSAPSAPAGSEVKPPAEAQPAAQKQEPRKTPALTEPQAKEALDEIYAIMNRPDNKKRLTDLVKECTAEGLDATQQMMMKMTKFPAVVTELCSGVMANFGFLPSEMMPGMIQIQAAAIKDQDMQKKVYVLMQAFQGNFIDEEIDEEGEECD